jgi:hypothetical protein
MIIAFKPSLRISHPPVRTFRLYALMYMSPRSSPAEVDRIAHVRRKWTRMSYTLATRSGSHSPLGFGHPISHPVLVFLQVNFVTSCQFFFAYTLAQTFNDHNSTLRDVDIDSDPLARDRSRARAEFEAARGVSEVCNTERCEIGNSTAIGISLS